jgi:hypothetical protein
MPSAYQLRAVSFRRDLFENTADCLTAAYTSDCRLTFAADLNCQQSLGGTLSADLAIAHVPHHGRR